MPAIIKKNVVYGGGGSNIELDTTLTVEGKAADAKAVGDAINVRSNSETGYLEVKVDGEWEQSNLKAISNGEVLFSANNNAVNFVAYSGNINPDTITTKEPVVTFGEKLSATLDVPNPPGGLYAGSMISDLVDITDYTKIVLNHESTSTGTSNWEWAKLFVVSSKSSKMSALATKTILQSQSSSSGVVELDISSISGENHIGIELCTSGKKVTVNVNEMYLE